MDLTFGDHTLSRSGDMIFFPSTFGLVMPLQTERVAYEPIVHWHRWAQ